MLLPRTGIAFAFALAAVAALPGCAPEASAPMDAGVTYRDLQPMLQYKCAPCHTEMNQAGHNIATNYADALKPISGFDSFGCWKDTAMTMPITVGECALVLSRSGRMPYGYTCDSFPTLAICVQPNEQAQMQAWIAAGMPP